MHLAYQFAATRSCDTAFQEIGVVSSAMKAAPSCITSLELSEMQTAVRLFSSAQIFFFLLLSFWLPHASEAGCWLCWLIPGFIQKQYFQTSFWHAPCSD